MTGVVDWLAVGLAAWCAVSAGIGAAVAATFVRRRRQGGPGAPTTGAVCQRRGMCQLTAACGHYERCRQGWDAITAARLAAADSGPKHAAAGVVKGEGATTFR